MLPTELPIKPNMSIVSFSISCFRSFTLKFYHILYIIKYFVGINKYSVLEMTVIKNSREGGESPLYRAFPAWAGIFLSIVKVTMGRGAGFGAG